MNTAWSIVVGVGLFVLAGCAPGLGTTLRVDYIDPEEETLPISAGAYDVRYRMGEISDRRARPAIAEINGRQLQPEGDITLSARLALQAGLRTIGASPSLYGGHFINAEVTDWYAKIQPDFPLSQVDARATLRLSVREAGGKQVYAAQYSGTVTQKHPFLDQDMIEKALGDAMTAAMREAVDDPDLLAALRTATRE